MPVIKMEVSKLTKEQKQTLVKEFTESASRITGIKEEAFVVLIKENEFDNIGVGGKLMSDMNQDKNK
ncbi:MAG TPA: 4-oxalocrotonate tautomerase [Clostridium sp.]|nr:4-oxalocrotonate tautomerase [Clostridium sp.]